MINTLLASVNLSITCLPLMGKNKILNLMVVPHVWKCVCLEGINLYSFLSFIYPMIVVISIGGSVIAPTLDAKRFIAYAEVIKEIAKSNTVLIVTGGGKAARDYIGVARSMGANEAVCDLIGISLSRLNARLLISALSSVAFQDIPHNYMEAENAMSSHKVVIMGGVTPGQTTDARFCDPRRICPSGPPYNGDIG